MVYNHHTVKHFIHGAGSIKQAADIVKNLGGKKAFIVTDPGLAKVGVQKPLEDALTAGGVEWELFAKAELEPSMDSIQACTDAAKAFGAEVLIGIGGGSPLDTTKAAAVLMTNEGPIDKYFGMNLVPNACLPMILIPPLLAPAVNSPTFPCSPTPRTAARRVWSPTSCTPTSFFSTPNSPLVCPPA